MLLKKADLPAYPCPVRVGVHCTGPRCPVWREHSADDGWCGMGGPVSAYSTQPAPQTATRPVHAEPRRARRG